MAVTVSAVARPHPRDKAATHENSLFASVVAHCLEDRCNSLALEDGRTVILAGFTSTTSASWRYLRDALTEDAYLRLRDTSLAIVDHVRSPFPVIKLIGYDSYSAETALVWYEGRHAVCKMFRYGFPHHYESEVSGLTLADSLGIGPAVLQVGPNWIVMEYFRGYSPLRLGWNRLLPPAPCRIAFDYVRRLHDEGIAMFDFNMNNVMVNGIGDVKIIDFADSLKYKGSVPPFSCNPVIAGKSTFERAEFEYDVDDFRLPYYRMNGPGATYQDDWYPYIGVSLNKLMQEHKRGYAVTRSFFLVSKRIPAAIRRT